MNNPAKLDHWTSPCQPTNPGGRRRRVHAAATALPLEASGPELPAVLMLW